MAIATLKYADDLANLMQRVRGVKSWVKTLPTMIANQSAQAKTERDNIAGLIAANPTLVSAAVKADLVLLRDLVNRVCVILDAGQVQIQAATDAEAGNLD